MIHSMEYQVAGIAGCASAGGDAVQQVQSHQKSISTFYAEGCQITCTARERVQVLQNLHEMPSKIFLR